MKDVFERMRSSWLIPILLLVLVNTVYFAPVVFQNKTIPQDDILMGLAKGKEIVDYRAKTGEEPLWTNSMFSGMPTFQISTLYPNNVLGYVQTLISHAFGLEGGIYIIASMMLGFFFLLRSSKVNPWISTVGAIAFGFSAFFLISLAAGHNAKIRTIVYMAPLLMGILLTLRGRLWLGFALTAFFTGMSIHANHFQITYYTLLPILAIIGVYMWQAFREKHLSSFFKKCLVLLVAALLGVGPNIGNLWSTYAYTKSTMRGGHSDLTPPEGQGTQEPSKGLDFDYAMSWSYGIKESFNLFIPNLMGGGAKQSYEGTETHTFVKNALSQQGMGGDKLDQTTNQYAGSVLYWGDQSLVNGAYYVGAVVFFLFVLGLFLVKGTTRQWIVITVVAGLLLAWGKNAEWINRFLFEYLPLYNKFRVPSMALVVLLLAIPYLGFIALQQWVDKTEKDAVLEKKLLYAVYTTGGLALLIALFGSALFSFESPRDAEFAKQGFDTNLLMADRKSLLQSSATTSLVYVLLTALVLWLQLKGKLKTSVAVLAIGGLVLFDLWSFDKDQLGSDDFVTQRQKEAHFIPTSADELIKKDADIHYRVFNTTAGLTSDSYTSYHHKSIGGYHGAKLARYQDLIDRQLSKGNMAVYNMLNAKWFIIQGQSGQLSAQANFGAMGNAWFPQSSRIVPNADEAMAAMDNFHPGKTLIVEAVDAIPLASAHFADSLSAARISLTQYDPKKLVYSVSDVKESTVAVFSEIFYTGPGQQWTAEADGKPLEIFRANYVLRAAVIPANTRELVFRFEPITYAVGGKLDLAFSGLLVLALGLAFWFERKS